MILFSVVIIDMIRQDFFRIHLCMVDFCNHIIQVRIFRSTFRDKYYLMNTAWNHIQIFSDRFRKIPESHQDMPS